MASTAFYEFRNFHNGPSCDRVAVPCGWASGVMIVCLACGCAAELQALGGMSSMLEVAQVAGVLQEALGDTAMRVAGL